MVQAGRVPDAQECRKSLLEFMDKTGFDTKGYTTTPLSAGGAFVPTQFLPDLIDLQDEYGDTRALCNVVQMTSDTTERPRTTGMLDMYYPGEGGTATESSTTQDMVKLEAKKGFTLVKMSSEILEDSAIPIAEFVARKIAQSEAFTVDNTWVNGDGSPGSAGDKRIPNCLGYLNLFGSTATEDSRSTTGGATADAHTIAHLTKLMSRLPRWARRGAVFVCSPEIDSVTFQRLGITEVGGLTATEFQGQTVSAFRGHPIVHVATMPTAIDSDADQVDILFGRFDLSNMLGDRRTLEITTSGVDRHFDTDEIAVRGIVRHDFNIHDLGSTTTASPVAALWQDHT
jgi:HK97 family phage major capsid protein